MRSPMNGWACLTRRIQLHVWSRFVSQHPKLILHGADPPSTLSVRMAKNISASMDRVCLSNTRRREIKADTNCMFTRSCAISKTITENRSYETEYQSNEPPVFSWIYN